MVLELPSKYLCLNPQTQTAVYLDQSSSFWQWQPPMQRRITSQCVANKRLGAQPSVGHLDQASHPNQDSKSITETVIKLIGEPTDGGGKSCKRLSSGPTVAITHRKPQLLWLSTQDPASQTQAQKGVYPETIIRKLIFRDTTAWSKTQNSQCVLEQYGVSEPEPWFPS